MTENNSEDPCQYCEGKGMREALADALESGRYEGTRLSRAREGGPLRRREGVPTEVIAQRKCPRQFFRRSVTETGWPDAVRDNELAC